jgi:hypothetical protein
MIKNSSLLNLCTKLYQKRQLAPFYHLCTPRSVQNKREFTQFWLKGFFQSVTNEHLNFEQGTGHPDIHYLTTDAAFFHLEDFNIIHQIQSVRPRELNYHFVIIDSVQRFNRQNCQCLLKVLEKPANPLVVFLLNYDDSHLIETLRSRAMRICGPLEDFNDSSPDKSIWEQAVAFIKSEDYIAFQSFYSNLKESELGFLKDFYHWFLAGEFNNYQMNQKMMNLSSWLQKSKTFNNSSNERAFFIFQFCKNLIKV